MPRSLDGPRLAPLSGGMPQSLVVLIHGYGASGDDLIGLAREWQPLLPETAFVAPHAPERLPYGGMGGYQWFHLTLQDEAELWPGVCRAAPDLDAFIDRELSRHALDGASLALAGFSQGTMMALHAGLRRSVPCAGIIGYSGALAGPEHLAGEITARPPVLLVHGEEDKVIPVGAMHLAARTLAGAEVAVEWHVCHALGHGIDRKGLVLGGDFLKHALGRARSRT